MQRSDWSVGDFSIRPVTRLQGKDECTYCGVERGGEHKSDCVMRERTVIVRMEFEYVIKVPESWTPAQIESHRNEGTWCATNAVGELDNIIDKGNCLCDHAKATYVREADENDERNFEEYIVDSKS